MAGDISYRARYARDLIRDKLAAEIPKLKQKLRDDQDVGNDAPPGTIPRLAPQLGLVGDAPMFKITPSNLPPDPRLEPSAQPCKLLLPEKSKVCIVGAGVAGLYIAMMLDSLEIPGLEYEILEASDRIGGRLDTFRFSKDPHDYYDIGAMRFPKLKIMDKVFELFDILKVPQITYYLNKGAVKVPGRFNDITYLSNGDEPAPKDIYRVSKKNGGSVPDSTVDDGVDKILNEAFGPYKDALQRDWRTGFDKLKEVDEYSTRQYLRCPPPGPDPKQSLKGYDFFSIQWMETMNTSSGLFDQAFSESVIDSFDFDAPGPDGENWICIEGGSSLIAEAMVSRIKGKVQTKKRVTKIAIDRSINSDSNMIVQVAGESKPREYVTVFNTTSLGCLQRMDLRNLELHPSQKDAIRALHYDDSAKVAIKFSYPWWIVDCGIKSGGAASTDLPLRTCVYPSYNLKDPANQSSVLLCSYTWAQDATRIGSLLKGDPSKEEELLETLFNDLALLHEKNFPPDMTYEQIREKIAKAYLTHNAFSWSHDPYTSGAFALFGPGQFQNLYPYLTRPTADAKFHIVGEASSAHHAWVVGALDSAEAAVHKFFNRYQLFDKQKELIQKWGAIAELETGYEGTEHLQVLLGTLKEGEHVKV